MAKRKAAAAVVVDDLAVDDGGHGGELPPHTGHSATGGEGGKDWRVGAVWWALQFAAQRLGLTPDMVLECKRAGHAVECLKARKFEDAIKIFDSLNHIDRVHLIETFEN